MKKSNSQRRKLRGSKRNVSTTSFQSSSNKSRKRTPQSTPNPPALETYSFPPNIVPTQPPIRLPLPSLASKRNNRKSAPKKKVPSLASKRKPAPKKKTPPPSQTFMTLAPELQSVVNLSEQERNAQIKHYEMLYTQHIRQSQTEPETCPTNVPTSYPTTLSPTIARPIFRHRSNIPQQQQMFPPPLYNIQQQQQNVSSSVPPPINIPPINIPPHFASRPAQTAPPPIDIRYKKGSRWTDTEYDEFYQAIKNAVDTGISYKAVFKHVAKEMRSGRGVGNLRSRFNELASADGKYGYRSEEFGALEKDFNRIKAKKADSTGKCVVHRYKKKILKQKEKILEQRQRRKNKKEMIQDKLIGGLDLMQKLAEKEELEEQRRQSQLEFKKMQINQKKMQMNCRKEKIKIIKNIVDSCETKCIDSKANDLNKEDFRILRKGLLKESEEMVEEFDRINDGKYNQMSLVVKLLETAKLLQDL